MTILFRKTNVELAEAARQLRGNQWFMRILKVMEKQADEEVRTVAYMQTERDYHAGRMALAIEFVDCFSDGPGDGNG